MPGVKNTQKRTSKKAVAAKRHNNKTVTSLMEGDSHFVLGRVEKNLGSGGFQVIVDDGTIVGMPLGKFTRSTMPIEANSFVVMEPSASNRVKVLEIVGVLSRSNAKALYKSERMSKKVWQSATDNVEIDDLFEENDEDSEDDSEGDEKEKKKSVKVDDDSDVDIDTV